MSTLIKELRRTISKEKDRKSNIQKMKDKERKIEDKGKFDSIMASIENSCRAAAARGDDEIVVCYVRPCDVSHSSKSGLKGYAKRIADKCESLGLVVHHRFNYDSEIDAGDGIIAYFGEGKREGSKGHGGFGRW
jgi:hypothetical protein